MSFAEHLAGLDTEQLTGLLERRPDVLVAPAPRSIRELALSRSGSVLVSAGQDRVLRVAELPSGKVHALDGHERAVASIDVSPDGRLAVLGGEVGTVRLWELPSGPGRVLERVQSRVGAAMRPRVSASARSTRRRRLRSENRRASSPVAPEP